MLCYDIWCQYSKKLKQRFTRHFPKIAPILDRLRGAVPKMHIKGHVLYCQLLWSFNYLPYSGETCGEMIETSWAENNQTAGSTKEMNEGHRHDALDDFFGYWNWTKFHEMCEFGSPKSRCLLIHSFVQQEPYIDFIQTVLPC